MDWIYKFIKRIYMSVMFDFIEKKTTYDVGRVRALVKFTNGKQCEITIIGRTEIKKESLNRKGEYVMEHRVIHATDIIKGFLQDIEDGMVDFLIGDNQICYRLEENKIDEVQFMETASHRVLMTEYDRVPKYGK